VSLLVPALAALVAACTAQSPAPPEHDLYFPAALAVSTDTRWLFLANANSDLKYGSGTVQAWDLDQVSALASSWASGTPPAGCAQDFFRPEQANCPSSAGGDPASFVVPGAVQIGNFAAGLAVEPMDDGSFRLFTTVRGDPSVSWIDFDPAAKSFSCGGSGSYPHCDEAHRLVRYKNSTAFPSLVSEPYGVSVDPLEGHVVLTHLTTGNVSLALAPTDPTQKPVLVDTISGLFAQGASSGGIGAIGVAPRLLGDPSGYFYVTSRFEARVALVRALSSPDDAGQPSARLVRGPSFFYTAGPPLSGADGDARAIRFSDDGSRAYLVSRTPASVIVVDTSLDEQGTPRNQVLGSVEVCLQPEDLQVADTGEGPRAYVPCFASGEVWVVDVVNMRLVDTIQVGRGPDAIAVSASRKQAYVANYGEDTVSVIDLDPSSPTYHHAVLALGLEREVSR
jgi:DNA-binding beta-propeller fold protein YncE